MDACKHQHRIYMQIDRIINPFINYVPCILKLCGAFSIWLNWYAGWRWKMNIVTLLWMQNMRNKKKTTKNYVKYKLTLRRRYDNAIYRISMKLFHIVCLNGINDT